MNALWRIWNHRCECGCGVIYECADCSKHSNSPRFAPQCAAKLPLKRIKVPRQPRPKVQRQAVRYATRLDLEALEALAGRFYGKQYIRARHAREDEIKSRIARKVR